MRQLHATAAERDYVASEYRAGEMGNETLARFAEYLASTLRVASHVQG